MKDRYTTRVAVYLILIKNGKTCLLRRYNTGWKDGFYSLIAGHVETGENAETATLREAREEAGITIKQEDIICTHVMHRNCDDQINYIDIFMQATAWEGTPENKEPSKCDHLDWFPLDQLPENTLDYIKKVHAHIQQGIFFSEFNF